MYIWDRMGSMKGVLVIVALIIAVASLFISNFLITDLRSEEYKKIEVWAEAMRSLNHADEHTDLALVLQVLNNNTTIPTIVRGKDGIIQDFRNISVPSNAEDDYLEKMSASFENAGRRIRIYFQPDHIQKSDYIDVLYDNSKILKRLYVYPFIQMVVMLLYVIVAIMALLSLKRSEQNKVWVGLSKETAHQLGTPISSLMAWRDILHANYPDDELITEMGKDVARLQLVADRFSKIGSGAELSLSSLSAVLDNVVDYIERRSSKRVAFIRSYKEQKAEVMVQLSPSLFEWVVEVLLKNAVDAMQGRGTITIQLTEGSRKWYLDISDTGKGILRSKFKTVFSPGYTTKKRGWGLGLSLAKRIVEEYHQGRIYVKRSEINQGATFRIELKK